MGPLSSFEGADAWFKGLPSEAVTVAETITEEIDKLSFIGKSAALTGRAEVKSLLGSSSLRGFLVSDRLSISGFLSEEGQVVGSLSLEGGFISVS